MLYLCVRLHRSWINDGMFYCLFANFITTADEKQARVHLSTLLVKHQLSLSALTIGHDRHRPVNETGHLNGERCNQLSDSIFESYWSGTIDWLCVRKTCATVQFWHSHYRRPIWELACYASRLPSKLVNPKFGPSLVSRVFHSRAPGMHTTNIFDLPFFSKLMQISMISNDRFMEQNTPSTAASGHAFDFSNRTNECPDLSWEWDKYDLQIYPLLGKFYAWMANQRQFEAEAQIHWLPDVRLRLAP